MKTVIFNANDVWVERKCIQAENGSFYDLNPQE